MQGFNPESGLGIPSHLCGPGLVHNLGPQVLPGLCICALDWQPLTCSDLQGSLCVNMCSVVWRWGVCLKV